jgi:DNA polymerase-2
VIYGDTDSVFVWLDSVSSDDEAMVLGKQLALQLNDWWQQRLLREYAIESFLEIEFETHYQKFLMPTIRGSDKGSKKRYAGVVSGDIPQLIFKGLENVRTDWTRLAREFQQELYRRIFFDEPYRDYVKTLVAELLAGKFNDQLVYRKRLRRKLEDYQRNIPPHVQAARKAVDQAGVTIRRGDWIEYVITVNGPEPLLAQVSQLDYQHIIDRQLAPVADSILYFLEDSLASIIDRQMAMF